jgi:hypothetical protein
MNGRFPEHLVSVVSDHEEIGDGSAPLVNTARRDWMTLENLNTEMPLTEAFAQPPLSCHWPDGQAAVLLEMWSHHGRFRFRIASPAAGADGGI